MAVSRTVGLALVVAAAVALATASGVVAEGGAAFGFDMLDAQADAYVVRMSVPEGADMMQTRVSLKANDAGDYILRAVAPGFDTSARVPADVSGRAEQITSDAEARTVDIRLLRKAPAAAAEPAADAAPAAETAAPEADAAPVDPHAAKLAELLAGLDSTRVMELLPREETAEAYVIDMVVHPSVELTGVTMRWSETPYEVDFTIPFGQDRVEQSVPVPADVVHRGTVSMRKVGDHVIELTFPRTQQQAQDAAAEAEVNAAAEAAPATPTPESYLSAAQLERLAEVRQGRNRESPLGSMLVSKTDAEYVVYVVATPEVDMTTTVVQYSNGGAVVSHTTSEGAAEALGSLSLPADVDVSIAPVVTAATANGAGRIVFARTAAEFEAAPPQDTATTTVDAEAEPLEAAAPAPAPADAAAPAPVAIDQPILPKLVGRDEQILTFAMQATPFGVTKTRVASKSGLLYVNEFITSYKINDANIVQGVVLDVQDDGNGMARVRVPLVPTGELNAEA